MSFWAKLCFKHALIRVEGLSQVSEVKPLPTFPRRLGSRKLDPDSK